MSSTVDRTELMHFMRILIYIAYNHSHKLYRTKLYKLIFLVQLFYSYNYNKLLFEQPFEKTLYHIKLKDIDEYLHALEEMGIIRLKQESTGVIIRSNVEPVSQIYSPEELTVLKYVIKHFEAMSSKEVEELFNMLPAYSEKEVLNLEDYYPLCEIKYPVYKLKNLITSLGE